jgi:hypothetical protein
LSIRKLQPHEKEELLCYADENTVLPDLIADVIDEDSSLDSVKKLIDAISMIFLCRAFDADIEKTFEEEWSEQWAEENEHLIYDQTQRAQDMITEKRNRIFD